MEDKSLKAQAEEIISVIDDDLDRVETQDVAIQHEVNSKANAIMRTISKVISDVDLEAAAARVDALKQAQPGATPEALAKRLIRDKCEQTGKVGAVTSGAALIPGVGTAAALTLGVAADIGATFKLHAELVLELAALYDYPLTDADKQRIVMAITGLSAGTSSLSRKAGEKAAAKIAEKYALKSVVKFLPVIGVVASAGTNVLATYVIGRRADAYFRLGPEAVGSWTDSLRTLSGVDERDISTWLSNGGKTTGTAIVSGARKVGGTGKAAGGALAVGTGKVVETFGPTLSTGAQTAGHTARQGARSYVRWFLVFWATIFGFVAQTFRLVWLVITFIPAKILGAFGRRKRVADHEASR
jgi:hypothetical protein